MSVHLLDQPLASFVARMRLARQHHLKWMPARNRPEAIEIGKDQVRPLVSSGSANNG